ncbi:hypothetical protein GF382_00920 [Candidatus Falkowbacteria bacterium]|nr:hypothetical protein [Candidatus Falkowbacteria bacterium]
MPNFWARKRSEKNTTAAIVGYTQIGILYPKPTGYFFGMKTSLKNWIRKDRIN